MIMGEVRGAGTARNHGGRPTNDRHRTLVMHLALDWLTATYKPPKRRRSDKIGFGDLAHSAWRSVRERLSNV
jgi:hypothetical protein